MPTPVTEIISGVSDVIVALCAVVTAGAAAIGLNTWKEKVKGSAEYDLAKQTLKNLYAVENAFRIVRNPTVWDHEYPEKYRVSGLQDQRIKKHEAMEYVYENRWKSLAAAFEALENTMYLVRAEWGTEQEDKIKSLRACKHMLNSALNNYLDSINKNTPPSRLEELKNEHKNISDTIYCTFDNKSEVKFEKDLRLAVHAFEIWLRPYVNKH